jgi:hypothetical protein
MRREGSNALLNSKTALKDMEVKHLPSCFLPGSQTFATADAIILTVDCLITVQVTLSREHTAKKSGFDGMRESGIRNRNLTTGTNRRWCHVFVTDEDSKANSLRRQTLSDLPEDISIYSTVFDVDRPDINVENIRAFDVSWSWLHAISAHLGMTIYWLAKIVWPSMMGNYEASGNF